MGETSPTSVDLQCPIMRTYPGLSGRSHRRNTAREPAPFSGWRARWQAWGAQAGGSAPPHPSSHTVTPGLPRGPAFSSADDATAGPSLWETFGLKHAPACFIKKAAPRVKPGVTKWAANEAANCHVASFIPYRLSFAIPARARRLDRQSLPKPPSAAAPLIRPRASRTQEHAPFAVRVEHRRDVTRASPYQARHPEQLRATRSTPHA